MRFTKHFINIVQLKKTAFVFVLLAVVFACTNTSKKQAQGNNLQKDIQVTEETQSIKSLLEQLSKKPLPENYTVVGELKTKTLRYADFGIGDMSHYIFIDAQNTHYNFNGNDTDVKLIVDAAQPDDENGGYEPNPEYLNKSFRVVWRTVKLNKEPSDIIETYYQEYDEIIYLKLLE